MIGNIANIANQSIWVLLYYIILEGTYKLVKIAAITIMLYYTLQSLQKGIGLAHTKQIEV